MDANAPVAADSVRVTVSLWGTLGYGPSMASELEVTDGPPIQWCPKCAVRIQPGQGAAKLSLVLGNPSSEPIASLSVTYEQYRVITRLRWRRREHIVDSEVSVRVRRDGTRVVGDISTEERGEYGIFTCRPDVVSGPNQALSFDLDFPV